MSVTEPRVDTVIDAIQEALVDAANRGLSDRWDDLEREAFAHDVATRHVNDRARRTIEHGEAPLTAVAESELIGRALAAYFGAGKFQVLLDLDEVTDIHVNRYDAIFLRYVNSDRFVRFEQHLFGSDTELRDEVARLARRSGSGERQFNDARPLLVLRLPDGCRLAAVMHVSPFVQVAIRRNLLPVNLTFDELVVLQMIDLAIASFLRACVAAFMRIVFVGATGAGKTTMLRACVNDTATDTRYVVIEDTKELDIGKNPARTDYVCEWETREANTEEKGAISMRELLEHSLRFDPDWLMIGEFRNGDAAREALLAMQNGHPSLSTLHCDSAANAPAKLAQLLGQGHERFEYETASRLVASTVDFFVHVGFRAGRRVVTEVVEVRGFGEGDNVGMNHVFVPDASGRGIPNAGGAGRITDGRLNRLVEHGFDLNLMSNPHGWWTS